LVPFLLFLPHLLPPLLLTLLNNLTPLLLLLRLHNLTPPRLNSIKFKFNLKRRRSILSEALFCPLSMGLLMEDQRRGGIRMGMGMGMGWEDRDKEV
jgi:hypothetical protein